MEICYPDQVQTSRPNFNSWYSNHENGSFLSEFWRCRIKPVFLGGPLVLKLFLQSSLMCFDSQRTSLTVPWGKEKHKKQCVSQEWEHVQASYSACLRLKWEWSWNPSVGCMSALFGPLNLTFFCSCYFIKTAANVILVIVIVEVKSQLSAVWQCL